MRRPSIVQTVGTRSLDGSRCGYCGKDDGLVSFGLWAHTLTCEDYQALIDRGWRRSGKYLYKPDQRSSCCALYTIRMDVRDFQSSRSYRKVIGKVTREVQRNIDAHKGEPITDLPDPSRSYIGKRRESGVSSVPHSRVQSVELSLPRNMIEQAEQAQDPHGLRVTLEPASRTKEKFELYRKYQTKIHGDAPEDVTEKGFFRFLVENPLQPEQPVPGGPMLGAAHQTYRLSGKLIAVAVIDILPHCVSSVYFYYDPDYASWGLGKYSALREIALVDTYSDLLPDLHYYYMGYYIHTCPKMKYKAKFRPAYLLDPESYDWIPIERWLPHLEELEWMHQAEDNGDVPDTHDRAPRYHSFADPDLIIRREQLRLPPGWADPNRLTQMDLIGVRVLRDAGWDYLAESDVMLYQDTMAELRDYVAAVGPELSRRMILYVRWLKGLDVVDEREHDDVSLPSSTEQ